MDAEWHEVRELALSVTDHQDPVLPFLLDAVREQDVVALTRALVFAGSHGLSAMELIERLGG